MVVEKLEKNFFTINALHDTLMWVIKMEKILLVEPNYKNKYPPIGLMKISTYFKNKGDFVEFHKGLLPKNEVEVFDKVMITTLFTFDFEMCIQTINYYIEIVGIEKVYVGGIAATIMPDKFRERIPNIQIMLGQLTSSNILGYNDNINVDILELDYDILWDVVYDYQAADSYFIYTTRGCPRKCSFCAVKTLEPEFYDCNNIEYQIRNVDERFGIKKNLLVMDNNILYSEHFSETVEILYELGFGKDNNKIKKNNNMKYYLISLEKRIDEGRKYYNLAERIKKEILNLKLTRVSKADKEELNDIIELVKNDNDYEWVKDVMDKEEYIIDFFDRYHYHKITRHIDFNQGLDARLFTDDKAKDMSKLAVRPCRIAFDNLATKDDYFRAMELAVNHGILSFSNYLLYNYNEKPEDLWTRLNLNIQFCVKHKDKKISLFSFPMKYASIEHTDRKYVGKYWHKKYLRAINVILNVTSGVVAKEEDLFYRAFGKSEEEYIEILSMPDDFIRYRDFFEHCGLTQLWKAEYKNLSENEKEELLIILDDMVNNPEVLRKQYGEKLNSILVFYNIKKKDVQENLKYYMNFQERVTI